MALHHLDVFIPFLTGVYILLSKLEKLNLIYLFKICELKFDLHPITNLFKTVQQKEVWQPKYWPWDRNLSYIYSPSWAKKKLYSLKTKNILSLKIESDKISLWIQLLTQSWTCEESVTLWFCNTILQDSVIFKFHCI